ncbi:hypothetical protein CALVIDRAFT_567903 [Calocera viscosa TUFC12733]|uniref:Uncharacterized protein n=1 Tax=Calocera viscosa (strain TUFC12733) TaxID=1330018 RepID=A0A167HQR8_CALVF|nr:hypothetical protein CALVIDRAFT_567903 [Calocera viscosa TUFC12733]
MRILSFLTIVLYTGLTLALYLFDEETIPRRAQPSMITCPPVKPSDCPTKSVCGDRLVMGISGPSGTGAECLYMKSNGVEASCMYGTRGNLQSEAPTSYKSCCPTTIGTCTTTMKRAERRRAARRWDEDSAVSRRRNELMRDIEDEHQPW